MKHSWVCIPVFFTFACSNFPKDPEKTLEQVQGQTLKVGITHHPPFTIVSGNSPSGSEVDLVHKLAKELQADIEWVNNSEEVLFKKLEKFEIDLVIGGVTSKSPWKKHAGFTRPYLKVNREKYVFVVAPGENDFLMKVEKFLFEQKKEPLP